jgi:hypothetical protein
MDNLSNLITDINKIQNTFIEAFIKEASLLAESFKDMLDNATLGTSMSTPKGGSLWKWVLAFDHKVDPSEICDINASQDNGNGKGVYTVKEIPHYPAHRDCKCSLVAVADTTKTTPEEDKDKWQVIISRTKIEFVNNSIKYIEKKEGTPTRLKGTEVVDPGKEPSNFDASIFEMFIKELDGLVTTVGNKTIKL